MKKIFVILLLFLVALLPHAANGNQPTNTNPPVYARLVMPLFFESKIPEDVHLIQQAAKRITEEKIGASVEFVPLLYTYSNLQDPVRMAELEMLFKQGGHFDLFPDVIQSIEPLALDSLLDLYGKEASEIISPFRMAYNRQNGPLYGLNSMNEYVSSFGVTMRKDIVEKYEIDLSNIHTLEDLDALFAYVHEMEPKIKLIAPYHTRYSFLGRQRSYLLNLTSLFIVSIREDGKLENYYATNEYQKNISLIRGWYEAGYIPDSLAFQSIRASQLINAGELFAYFSPYKPGIDFEHSLSCGMEMVTVSLSEPLVTRQSLENTRWSISAMCVNAGKAMQLLNLLYTDNELVNLLLYGIEGLHYVVLEDGTIDYPQNVSSDTVGYKNTLSWLLPNQTVSNLWHGNDPDLWEQLKAYNESAPVSDMLYFVFDDTGVAEESQKVHSILNKYLYGLETGQLNPIIYLPMMLQEMEEAGAERVINAAQKQYDLYLAEKDISK